MGMSLIIADNWSTDDRYVMKITSQNINKAMTIRLASMLFSVDQCDIAITRPLMLFQ